MADIQFSVGHRRENSTIIGTDQVEKGTGVSGSLFQERRRINNIKKLCRRNLRK